MKYQMFFYFTTILSLVKCQNDDLPVYCTVTVEDNDDSVNQYNCTITKTSSRQTSSSFTHFPIIPSSSFSHFPIIPSLLFTILV